MFSRILVTVLLDGLGLPALCQKPQTTPATSVPDYALYSSFFFRIAWADSQARKMASQGISDTFYRTLIQRQVGLTGKEAAALTVIAADWRQKDSQILGAIQAARLSGAQANSTQTQNLSSQRVQTVLDHVSQLQAGMGNVRFQVVDGFVHQPPPVKPPTLPSPPRRW